MFGALQDNIGWFLLLVMIILANLPFFVGSWLIFLKPAKKNIAHHLLELLLGYGVCLGLGVAVESSIGQRFEQGWSFYVALACLFVILAFPGFIYRYLLNRRLG